jgi:FPC/CPF motif-containing protein YcgG
VGVAHQPRNVFDGIEGGSPAGTKARRNIRNDLAAWDTADPHPSMGDYGDQSNHEWQQYYIADDATSMYGSCPLRACPGRRSRRTGGGRTADTRRTTASAARTFRN